MLRVSDLFAFYLFTSACVVCTNDLVFSPHFFYWVHCGIFPGRGERVILRGENHNLHGNESCKMCDALLRRTLSLNQGLFSIVSGDGSRAKFVNEKKTI